MSGGQGWGQGGVWAPTTSVPMLTPRFVPSAALAVALEHLARPGEGKLLLGQPLD